jgi:hypothetical protein
LTRDVDDFNSSKGTFKMPATTRSANKQTKLEDVGAGSTSAKSSSSKSKSRTSGQKRKADEPKSSVSKAAKKTKQSQSTTEDTAGSSDDVIIINRAPVLELWASCVAQFLHPHLSWATSLSIGGAIATITAISKGRSIGKIDKPDPGEAQKKREERKRKAEKENLGEIEVMSFKLNLNKDGQAMVGGKPKKAGEEALIKKYGGTEHYERVRQAFQDALKAWKGQGEDLDKRAFHAYELFRPSVSPGQKGWGRKGQLNLKTVKSAVADG